MDKVKLYNKTLIQQLNTLRQRIKEGDITPNQTAKDIKRIANKLTQVNKI